MTLNKKSLKTNKSVKSKLCCLEKYGYFKFSSEYQLYCVVKNAVSQTTDGEY